MLQFNVVTLSRLPAASLLLGLALAGAPGCNNNSANESPATRFCGTLSEYTTACAAVATPCDQAMVADCSGVVGLVSDGFLQSAGDCIASGGAPLGCLAGAIGGLQPSAAHEAFVAEFCGACALGIGGCEDVLLGRSEGPPELKAASLLVLPLGDSLVDALREKCTTGLTCLATFPSCAQGVLLEQAIPEQTVQCLIDGFSGKLPEGAPVSEDSLAACGLGGTGASVGEEGQTGVSSPGSATDPAATSTGDDVPTGGVASTSTSPSTSEPDTTSTGAPDPGASATDTGPIDTTGDPPGPDTDSGDTDAWEMLCAEPFSKHNECGVGVPLPLDCTWCSYLVCTYFDGFCCTDGWDDLCREKALERCSMACGATTDVCAHSPCTEGVALTVSCSDCVTAVCAGRPSCCEVEWDAECTTLATACGVC